jgi:hypothetical protein
MEDTVIIKNYTATNPVIQIYYLFDENKYYACETSGGVYPVGKVSNEYRGGYYYIFPV